MPTEKERERRRRAQHNPKYLEWRRAYQRTAAYRAKENARNQRVYRDRRDALLDCLGPKCAICGYDKRDNLEFDHDPPESRTWQARGTSRLQRMRLYERDAAAGVIRVLCLWCNRGWAKPDVPEYDRDAAPPPPTPAEMEAAAQAPF